MCELCGNYTRVIPLEALGCGHTFHVDCLRRANQTCAVCGTLCDGINKPVQPMRQAAMTTELDFDVRPDWDFPWFVALVIIFYALLTQYNQRV